jgi:hypothetical protein
MSVIDSKDFLSNYKIYEVNVHIKGTNSAIDMMGEQVLKAHMVIITMNISKQCRIYPAVDWNFLTNH